MECGSTTLFLITGKDRVEWFPGTVLMAGGLVVNGALDGCALSTRSIHGGDNYCGDISRFLNRCLRF